MRFGLVGSLALGLLSGSWAIAQQPTPTVGNPVSVLPANPSVTPLPAGDSTSLFAATTALPEVPAPSFYARGEYLLWFVKPYDTISLVQVIPTNFAQNPTDPIPAGVATTVIPTERLSGDALSGFRINAGLWLDEAQSFGADFVYWRLPRTTKTQTVASPGEPVITRSVIPAGDGTAAASGFFIYASPFDGGIAGSVSVSSAISMDGAEANARIKGDAFFADYVDYLVGFKYVNLDETLRISDRRTFLDSGLLLTSSEAFRTRNQFYGAQIGAHTHYRADRWSADLLLKFAVGAMNTTVERTGATTAFFPGLPPQTLPGALLVQPSNLGTRSDTQTVVIPELTFNLGYQLTDNLQLFVGYNFMLISTVYRPGATIDPSVNPASVPFLGAIPRDISSRPAPVMLSDNFWVQGINFGLTFTY